MRRAGAGVCAPSIARVETSATAVAVAIATVVAVAVATLLGAACSGDGRVLAIAPAEGGAPPREVRVGDTLRLVASLEEPGAAGAAGAAPAVRNVSNAPAMTWRATPTGIAVFSPGGGATDPVVATFQKEGTATLWATYERLESVEWEIVVRARGE